MIGFLSEFDRKFDKSDQIGYRNLSHDFGRISQNLGRLYLIGKKGRLLIFCPFLRRNAGNLRKWLIGIFCKNLQVNSGNMRVQFFGGTG